MVGRFLIMGRPVEHKVTYNFIKKERKIMNRKKITALLGAAALAMSALAGCGGGREGAASTPAPTQEAAVEEITEVAAGAKAQKKKRAKEKMKSE